MLTWEPWSPRHAPSLCNAMASRQPVFIQCRPDWGELLAKVVLASFIKKIGA
jgi:hypothetical protein